MNDIVGKKRKINDCSVSENLELIEPSLKRRKLEVINDSYQFQVSSRNLTNWFSALFKKKKCPLGSPVPNGESFFKDGIELGIEFSLKGASKEMFINHLRWNNEVVSEFRVEILEREGREKVLGDLLHQLCGQVAFLSCPDTDHIFIMYSTGNNGSIHALLCEKFTMVLDLDNTLIDSRLSKTRLEEVNPTEQLLVEFQQRFGVRIFTSVKDYCKALLPWISRYFKIVIVSNSVFPYALEIAKILDPFRKHVLKGVTTENLPVVLKTRRDLLSFEVVRNGVRGCVKMKDLESLNLKEYRSIIFDDQVDVWFRNQRNVLPFEKVTCGESVEDVLETFRESCWKKIVFLQLVKSSRKHDLFEFSSPIQNQDRQNVLKQFWKPALPLQQRVPIPPMGMPIPPMKRPIPPMVMPKSIRPIIEMPGSNALMSDVGDDEPSPSTIHEGEGVFNIKRASQEAKLYERIEGVKRNSQMLMNKIKQSRAMSDKMDTEMDLGDLRKGLLKSKNIDEDESEDEFIDNMEMKKYRSRRLSQDHLSDPHSHKIRRPTVVNNAFFTELRA